ncbi:MAG: hypothetical protein RLZZ308_430 [Candidatus Parcubacteria bacterium]|jgi:hypothetical protein
MNNPLTYSGYASDPPGTKRFDDAICFHKKTPWGKAVSICATSIIVDPSHKEELLQRACFKQGFHLSQEEQEKHSFSIKEHRKAVCVSIQLEYGTARQIAIADLKLREHLTEGWYDKSKKTPDLVTSKFITLAENYSSVNNKYTPEQEIVNSLILMFNKICSTYLCGSHVPFIKTRGNYCVDVGFGFGIFNKPLRDNYSFLNNAQLSYYIQHGKRLFTRNELEQVLRRRYHSI